MNAREPGWLTRLGLGLIRALAGRGDREWGEAMIAEWRCMRGGPAAGRWLASCAWGAIVMRANQPATAYVGAYLCLVAVTIAVDWRTDLAAPSLALLAFTGLLLGWLAPRRIARAALLAGAVLPLAHAVANLFPPLWPFYQYKPLDGFDWLVLASLFAPAAVAAAAGAGLRRIS